MRHTRNHRNITFKRLAFDAYQFMRVQKKITRVVGPPFSRSQNLIEMDITYRCNLRCNNCNRSCTQAPSTTDIAPEKIASFIQESISLQVSWKRIRLLGGEPTLHPRLNDLLAMLLNYKTKHQPRLRIVLCTNGSGQRVKDVLSKLPREIVIKDTSKGSRQRLFRPFNMAPIDNPFYRLADFASGCRIIKECGLGMTPSGYYPCAVAGGIDRVFGFNRGRPHLPLPNDHMRDQMALLCRYCGHYGFLLPLRKQKTSLTWKNAYSAYKQKQRNRPQSGSSQSVYRFNKSCKSYYRWE